MNPPNTERENLERARRETICSSPPSGHARIGGKTRGQRRQFGIQNDHIVNHELLRHDWIGLVDRQHIFALNHKGVETFVLNNCQRLATPFPEIIELHTDTEQRIVELLIKVLPHHHSLDIPRVRAFASFEPKDVSSDYLEQEASKGKGAFIQAP
ncbi:hypothetical protein TNCV_800601 [Trichonephila clavipes]|nr:hypothetical protein TNCV_800601 [Trichonephila clavipes]